jgi:coenzyme F420 hydrogenase subunit beta
LRLASEIIEKGLCCGCGTCAGVCPKDAIQMKLSSGLFVPEIDAALCKDCQLCSQSCPGKSVDFEELQFKIFNQKPQSNTIGNYSNCYTGYSLDDHVRFDSSSGGIITQLLLYALEKKLIDGAIVTRMSKNNPLQPEAFIARTPEDIIGASKSKYCPVAVNVCLKQVLKEDGKFAVVGLPCHIQGIRKAEKIFKPLEKKIVLHLGLLCSHTVDFEGINFLLKKLQIPKNQIMKMSFRGQGWPGSLSIETKKGSKTSLPLVGSWHAYWPLFSSFFFTPMRCTMCPDQAAELADISFGDAWLPEMKRDKKGVSIVISRTNRGQRLLDQAALSKVITLNPLDIKKVEASQLVNLKFKKNDLPSRLSLMTSMGKDTPSYPDVQLSFSAISALRALYIYSSIKASSNETFKSFLEQVPFPIIRLYYGIYKALCKI